MNRNQFDKTERRDVSDKDLKDAFKGVLLATGQLRILLHNSLE